MTKHSWRLLHCWIHATKTIQIDGYFRNTMMIFSFASFKHKHYVCQIENKKEISRYIYRIYIWRWMDVSSMTYWPLSVSMKYEAFLMSEQLKSIHISNYLNLEEVSLTNLFSLLNIIKYIDDYLTFECRKKVVSIYLSNENKYINWSEAFRHCYRTFSAYSNERMNIIM